MDIPGSRESRDFLDQFAAADDGVRRHFSASPSSLAKRITSASYSAITSARTATGPSHKIANVKKQPRMKAGIATMKSQAWRLGFWF